jgi:hypothetical protein
VELLGRLVSDQKGGRRAALRGDGHEAGTWRQLIADALEHGRGVPVVAVGRRVAPAGAGRAECINLAARHVHALRGRLSEGTALITHQHAYRLSEAVSVGRVTPRR